MVDVQQGDGMVLETPPDENDETRLVFIDGGDNKLFARHVAARYRHRQSSAANPLEVDLILITHGDADHFEGLTDIKRSETEPGISGSEAAVHPSPAGLPQRPCQGTGGRPGTRTPGPDGR